MELNFGNKNAIEIPGAIGLEITTISGMVLHKVGRVAYDEETETYYCAGASWPEEIVSAVQMGKEAIA